MKKVDLSEDFLKQQFQIEKKKLHEVVKNTGFNAGTIRTYCKKYDIKIRQREDFTGRTYGKITVLNFAGLDKKGHSLWNCICACGKECKYVGCVLKHNQFPTCGCSRSTSNNKHPLFKGYKEISGRLWYEIRRGANERKLQFSITLEYVWELFLKQNKQCSLSGVELSFSKSNSKNFKMDRTASLDRIDSNNGYVEGNVQWVHRDINYMKMNLDNNKFINWCKLVAKNKETNDK